MEENNFEKQVQQKMNELQMQPSDAVWENVEERIRQRKPSRRWLLLLLFGCVAGGGFWVWNSFDGSKTNTAGQKNIRERSKEENYKSPQSNLRDDTFTNEQNNSSRRNTAISAAPIKSIISKRFRLPITVMIGHQQQALQTMGKASSDILITNQSETASPQAMPGHVKSIDGKKRMEEINLFTKEIINGYKKIATSKDTIVAAKKVKNQNLQHLWQFGITLIPSISGVGSNFLALNNAFPAAYFNSAGQYTGSPGAVISSSMKSAFGFMTGIFAEKKINNKWVFQTGLNFIAYNISNETFDSSGIPNVFMSAKKNYQNHFDFISIPVGIKFQLNKSKSVPVFLQAGASISQLIHTDALQLNYSNGYYYHDNSLFNKTQTGIDAGATVELFAQKKMPLLIGPYMSYHLSRVAKGGLYNDAHFVFAGLNVSVLLKK